MRRKLMTPQSRKAKGRKFQQEVRNVFRKLGEQYGLEADDFRSCSMGAGGEDIIFSPAARSKLKDIRVECKHVEKLSVVPTFFEHNAKYPNSDLNILVHRVSRKEALCTLRFSDFIRLLTEATGK